MVCSCNFRTTLGSNIGSRTGGFGRSADVSRNRRVCLNSIIRDLFFTSCPRGPCRVTYVILRRKQHRIHQNVCFHIQLEGSTMMKFAAVASLLASSASAFAPAQQSATSVTSLNAERSQSLPFMNRPPLVSLENVVVTELVQLTSSVWC